MRAPNVVLLNDSLEGEVSLNLEHRDSAVLYNAEYFGVFFEVDDRTLVRGLDVIPRLGPIPPRGVVVLKVRALDGDAKL